MSPSGRTSVARRPRPRRAACRRRRRSSSSWAIVSRRRAHRLRRPSAPSRPMPVSTTADGVPAQRSRRGCRAARRPTGGADRPPCRSRARRPAAVEQQVGAVRRDPDAGRGELARLARAARAAAPRVEPAGEPVGEAGDDVLHDEDRQRERRRERAEQRRAARAARRSRRRCRSPRGRPAARRPAVAAVAAPAAGMADHARAAEQPAAVRRSASRAGAVRVAQVERVLRHRVERAGGERRGAACEPGPTWPESTRIGTGCELMICSIASSPDMPGQLEVHRHEVGLQSRAARRSPPRRVRADADDLELAAVLEQRVRAPPRRSASRRRQHARPAAGVDHRPIEPLDGVEQRAAGRSSCLTM